MGSYMKPENLAICVDRYLPNSETFIFDRIRSFKHFNPVVICRKDDYAAQFQWPYIFSYLRRKNKYNTYKKYVTSLIQENRISLLQVHHSVNAFPLIRVAKKTRVPLITFFHGTDIYFFRGIFFRLRLKNLFHQGDYFVVNSDDMKKNIIKMGCNPSKIFTNTAGIDSNKFIPKDWSASISATFRMVMVGRFIEVKGLLYGIKAFKIFFDKHKTGSLTIIGDGELRKEYEKEAEGYPIVFMGMQPHQIVAEEIRKSDLVLIPSVFTKKGIPDSCNNVVKEAMACAVPVIASRIAAIPEMVVNKETGLLFEEKNHTELALHIEFFFKNQPKLSEFGKKSYERFIKNYTLDAQMKRLEELYVKIIRQYRI